MEDAACKCIKYEERPSPVGTVERVGFVVVSSLCVTGAREEGCLLYLSRTEEYTPLILDAIVCVFHEAPLLPFFFYLPTPKSPPLALHPA